jgi:hypothetical protein
MSDGHSKPNLATLYKRLRPHRPRFSREADRILAHGLARERVFPFHLSAAACPLTRGHDLPARGNNHPMTFSKGSRRNFWCGSRRLRCNSFCWVAFLANAATCSSVCRSSFARAIHSRCFFGASRGLPCSRFLRGRFEIACQACSRSSKDPTISTRCVYYRNAAIRWPSGRVEMWRGGCRLNISVAAPFVWRCLSGSTVAPFPHPAHRSGHADLPHPALGQDLTPSPTARRAQARLGVRARSAHKGARADRSRPCIA